MKELGPFLLTPLFAIIGRSGGMIVPFFIAHFYGVTEQTDAFFFASGIVMFLWGVFQQVFETVLLPFHAEHKRQSKEALAGFLRAVLYRILPLMIAGSVALSFALPWLLRHTSGLNAGSAGLVTEIFTLLIPFLILTVWVSAVNGILNSYKVFWFPAFSPFIRSVMIILAMFLLHQSLGIHAITAGFVTGEFFRWMMSLWILSSLGFWGITSAVPGTSSGMKDFWRQSGFQILALGAVQIIPLVNQWCVSWLGVGGLSLLNYADRLYQIPFQLFLTGQSQIFFSNWADHYYELTREEFSKRVKTSLRLALAGVTVLVVVCWAGKVLLVRLAFGHGEIPEEMLRGITDLFGWLILSLPPAIANTLLLRVLFVMRKSGAFLLQSAVRLGLQLVLNIVFMKLYGISGVGMAALVSVGLTSVWMYFYIAWLWRQPKA